MGKIIFVLSLVLFVNFSAKGQETSTYYCPPCNCQAHETNEHFKESGSCPYCGMSLKQAQNTADPSISYQQLLKYEGKYEYLSGSTLQMMASPIDTTLYAVINNAKYPIFHVAADTFSNAQDIPVIFQRNGQGDIKGYTVDRQFFGLITTDITKLVMYPRKELFDHPESYTYHTPKEMNDGLETGHINNAFEQEECIKEMVVATIKGEYPDVHSILIYKDKKLVLEEYFYGYDKNEPHQLRSATKPFIGGIVGIAVDKGFIKSENEKLLPYFKNKYDKIANLDDRKNELTIENFLMYRHGMDCENNNPESKGNEQSMMQSNDWVKYTLDLPMMTKPGEKSSYCTGSTLTLGSLVEIATNEQIEDFAKQNLFERMGISNYEWTFEPNQASMNTFSQMYITPRDLIKLAKLFKDGGKWEGKQILSKDWIDKTFDMTEGDYGYLWEHKYFIIDGKQYNSYMASGNGGQKINIWPELDMITVFTGGNYNSYELYGKSTPPNEMIPKYILKSVK